MNSSNDFSISWADETDAQSLAPLLRKLYKHDVPEAPEPSSEDVHAHIRHLLAPSTPHKIAIAHTEDELAVGLAGVAFFVSISDPRPEKRIQMELKELFVLAEYRSFGVGSALMSWVESEALKKTASRMDWHVKTRQL